MKGNSLQVFKCSCVHGVGFIFQYDGNVLLLNVTGNISRMGIFEKYSGEMYNQEVRILPDDLVPKQNFCPLSFPSSIWEGEINING